MNLCPKDLICVFIRWLSRDLPLQIPLINWKKKKKKGLGFAGRALIFFERTIKKKSTKLQYATVKNGRYIRN